MRSDCGRHRVRLALGGVMLSTLFSLFTRPVLGKPQDASQSDLQQMQKKVDQLEQQIQDLKQQMAAATRAAAPNSAVANGQTPAAKPAEQPKSDSTVDFYGFAMLDSGYQFNTNDPNWFDVVRPTKLPAFKGEFAPDGKVFYGVRQTRFGVKALTPTTFGDLKTIFEFELFGTGVDTGQTTFRLRHAYGELGHFGAGQTWSPFMDIDVFPNSVEYWGPSGMVFFRNVQVRWMPLQGESNVVIALERPGASADGGVYSDRIELQAVKPQFKWPDLSGHVRVARKWGYVQFGAIFRKIAWVDTNPTGPNLSGTAYGWGVNISSNLKFSKNNVGKLQVVYGAGIENYMNDSPVDIATKNNFSNLTKPISGVSLPVLGVVAFLDHNWNEHFTSSAGYSLVNIANSNAQVPSDFHQGGYALGNLLYHPTKRVTMGGEFQFGRRVNFSDPFNVNDYRIQVSFKYDWSKGFEY
jgi:outer membrane murein-binding lipoprotein Lpp